MSDDTMTDFAVVAYRDEGRWEVLALPRAAMDDLSALVRTVRRLPSEAGVLALVSVADDFFVIVRVSGSSVRLLLSDSSAASEWPLARDVLDELGLDVPDDDDDVDFVGDPGIVADLGMSALELGALCDDLDLYPDEVLGRVAARIGVGDLFEEAVETALR